MAYNINNQSARDLLYKQDLDALREEVEQLRPDLDVYEMNVHELVQVILSSMPKGAAKSRQPSATQRRTVARQSTVRARSSAAPYSTTMRIRTNVPNTLSQRIVDRETADDDLYASCGALEPIRVLQRRITEARRPRPEAISDFGSKTINGTPSDVWGGSRCVGGVCEDEDSLDDALSAARRRGDNLIVSHRLVSTSLVPVNCDKPFAPSERSDYRRTRFSPRPATLNHIRSSTNSHYVPVIRLVTGDDRRSYSTIKQRYNGDMIDLTMDDDDEAYYLL